MSVVLFVFDMLDKFVDKDWPAIVFLDLVDVSDGGGEFVYHFPEVFVDFFWFLYAVLAVVDELVIKWHQFFEVNAPNLYCQIVIHGDVFSNEIKWVSVHVHVLEMAAVIVYLFLKGLDILDEIFGGLETDLDKKGTQDTGKDCRNVPV